MFVLETGLVAEVVVVMGGEGESETGKEKPENVVVFWKRCFVKDINSKL